MQYRVQMKIVAQGNPARLTSLQTTLWMEDGQVTRLPPADLRTSPPRSLVPLEAFSDEVQTSFCSARVNFRSRVPFTNPQDSAGAPSSIVGLQEIGHICSLRSLAPADLPLFSRLLQLPISLCMDLLLTPGEHVLRRDIADGTVQANVVVMIDVALHQSLRIVQ